MTNWSNPFYICKKCQDSVSEPYETEKDGKSYEICRNCLALDSFKHVKRNLDTGESIEI